MATSLAPVSHKATHPMWLFPHANSTPTAAPPPPAILDVAPCPLTCPLPPCPLTCPLSPAPCRYGRGPARRVCLLASQPAGGGEQEEEGGLRGA